MLDTCSVSSCDRPAIGGGLCEGHNRRKRKGYRGNFDASFRRMNTKDCSVGGCTEYHVGNGLCQNHRLGALRLARKKYFVERLGGKCVRCGVTHHYLAFDFHHRDPATKLFDICYYINQKNIPVLLAEPRKCELLCAVCHRLEHANYVRLEEHAQQFLEVYRASPEQ